MRLNQRTSANIIFLLAVISSANADTLTPPIRGLKKVVAGEQKHVTEGKTVNQRGQSYSSKYYKKKGLYPGGEVYEDKNVGYGGKFSAYGGVRPAGYQRHILGIYGANQPNGVDGGSSLTNPDTFGYVDSNHNSATTGHDSSSYDDLVPNDSSTADSSIAITGDVTGLVWEDSNMNGKRDNGEPGVPNARVFLCEHIDNNTGNCLEGTTDVNGIYRLSTQGSTATFFFVEFSLPDDFVGFTQPGGWSNVERSNESVGTTNIFPVPTAEVSFNAGLLSPVLVDGIIWHDLNKNGIQDNNEPVLGGVEVGFCVAKDDGGCKSTVTQKDGSFSVDPSGSSELQYFLTVALPSGFGFSTDESLRSDIKIIDQQAGFGRTQNIPKPVTSVFYSLGLVR